MKILLTVSAAVAALIATPLIAQMPPPEPMAMPAVPADPTVERTMPTMPTMPAVVQANPPGAGMPSMTPPNPMVASEPVPPALPADPGYMAGPYRGALTPPPAEAMGKVYPLCTRTLQDSCRNRGGV